MHLDQANASPARLNGERLLGTLGVPPGRFSGSPRIRPSVSRPGRVAAAGAASTVGFPSIIRAQGLNEKLQVGFVAVGGRAGAHTGASHKAGLQCVAFLRLRAGCAAKGQCRRSRES